MSKSAEQLPKRDGLMLSQRGGNGNDSMSPTVPPISEITTSAGSVLTARRMRLLISFVMCGITCTVAPRNSPRRSLRRTVSQTAPALWLAFRERFSSTKRS